MMLPRHYSGNIYQQHQPDAVSPTNVLDECSHKAYARVSQKYGYMSNDKKKLAVFGMTVDLISQEALNFPDEIVKESVDKLFD